MQAWWVCVGIILSSCRLNGHESVSGAAVTWLRARPEIRSDPVSAFRIMAPADIATDLPSTTIAFPSDVTALDALSQIDREQPAYVVVGEGVAWDSVRHQTWFLDRYQEVAQWCGLYPAVRTLRIYSYLPSPFDLGKVVQIRSQFQDTSVVLRGYRVSSPKVEPGRPFYLSLLWDDKPGGDYRDLTVTIQLVAVTTGRAWLILTDRLKPLGLWWQSDYRLANRYTLMPPEDLPEDRYELRVGLQERSGRPVEVRSESGDIATDLRLTELVHPPDISSVCQPTAHPVAYRIGENGYLASLCGFDVLPWAVPAGELRVELQWSALSDTPVDYKVFVHLLGPDGRLVTQADGTPVYGFYPTSSWKPGDFIQDVHTLTVPPELPAGEYRVSVGLYDPESDQRLPVFDREDRELPQSQIPLHTVMVYAQW